MDSSRRRVTCVVTTGSLSFYHRFIYTMWLSHTKFSLVNRAVCALSKQTISTLTQTERREQKGMTLLPHLLGLYTLFSCSLASPCKQSHTTRQIHLHTLLSSSLFYHSFSGFYPFTNSSIKTIKQKTQLRMRESNCLANLCAFP